MLPAATCDGGFSGFLWVQAPREMMELPHAERWQLCTSLELSPPSWAFPCAQSLNNLGVVYTSQGRAQEALTLLMAAIQVGKRWLHSLH